MVQRVARARVTVGAEVVLRMGEGLLAFIGVGRRDTSAAADELARRILHLRIFADAEQRMNCSLLGTGGTLGVVSPFTLFGDARQGRRPFARHRPAVLIGVLDSPGASGIMPGGGISAASAMG